jgi:hypothetical protein
MKQREFSLASQLQKGCSIHSNSIALQIHCFVECAKPKLLAFLRKLRGSLAEDKQIKRVPWPSLAFFAQSFKQVFERCLGLHPTCCEYIAQRGLDGIKTFGDLCNLSQTTSPC